MLVSLADMKTYLGESTADYDTFLTQQISIISEAIEGYCGRKFNEATYVETYYLEDILSDNRDYPRDLPVYHYPINSITDVTDVPIAPLGTVVADGSTTAPVCQST